MTRFWKDDEDAEAEGMAKTSAWTNRSKIYSWASRFLLLLSPYRGPLVMAGGTGC